MDTKKPLISFSEFVMQHTLLRPIIAEHINYVLYNFNFRAILLIAL